MGRSFAPLASFASLALSGSTHAVPEIRIRQQGNMHRNDYPAIDPFGRRFGKGIARCC